MPKLTQLSLLKKEIADEFSRENFDRISNYIRDIPLLKGKFDLKEVTIAAAGANQKIAHSLGFVPKDAFVTYKSPSSVTVDLNYELWTNQQLDITTSGAVTFRMFVGRYEETGA